MQAKDQYIVELIGRKDNIFYIPYYQRNYAWEVKNQVKQLWEDLCYFNENGCNNDYFFGSIIIKKDGSMNPKHELVDGQQRITTLLILIASLRDCSKKKDTTNYIKLIGWLESEENKFKLERIEDSDIIKKILTNNSKINQEEEKSNYYKVYEYFKNKISQINDDNDTFIDILINNVISRIKVASIYLDGNEDEFSIFESINSKGKELQSSDLIKNYIAKNLKNSNELLKKFENIFLSVFNIFPNNKEEMIADFYRNWFSIYRNNGKLLTKKGSKIYIEFKNMFNQFENNDEELRNEISKWIEQITNDVIIFKYIYTTEYKYYLYPLMDSNKNNFYGLIHTIIKYNSKIIENKDIIIENEKNIEWSLKYIASLVVGRTLVSFGRVESNRTYSTIAYNLNKEISDTGNFKESFKKYVIEKLENDNTNARMPSKDEIFNNIDSKKDLYSGLKSNLKSILIAIEEKMSYKILEKNKISIEHIFPQNSSEWEEICKKSNISEKVSFSDMKEWINTLGNLTIVDSEDNSRLSNKVFLEKKKILDEKSYLKINKIIFEYENWTVKEIKERARKILDDIKEIWF